MGDDHGIARLFAGAGCDGWLCVLDADGDGEVCLGADEQVVAASVVKVVVALEVFRQAEAGELELRERVRVRHGDRTGGPTGLSLFADEAEVSVRDLVTLMLTVSDNTATDLLLERAGLDRVAATLTELGLEDTVIAFTLRAMLDSIGRDAGFAGWEELMAALPDPVLEDRMRAARMMDAGHSIRTTARDMARLLRLIWLDRAGPPVACARVRGLMEQQVTRHRLAMGFPDDVRVAAKSGGLFGVVRNEVGVVRLPDGRRYAAAVFTRAHRPHAGDKKINTVIGTASARAVAVLRRRLQ
ncbi:serine hydrolase [Nonomuraea sp. SYSU D8015]|uniref:serine hydrolase n=1 Tax=Nonomuraea sp. SYSU D8015 TaxID=2593644 RepID=UPI0016610FF6|nr:serine hydrolase [Nonomuraea sp. SYSU D8015]